MPLFETQPRRECDEDAIGEAKLQTIEPDCFNEEIGEIRVGLPPAFIKLSLRLGQKQLRFAHINHLLASGTSELQGSIRGLNCMSTVRASLLDFTRFE